MSDSSAPRLGLWDAMRACMVLVTKLHEAVQNIARTPGPQGPEGKPGKLPTVKDWSERVYYEGDVVRFGGSTYQALRDTGNAPPGKDWGALALKGEDGREWTPRGLWLASETYRFGDVVAKNGRSYVAKRDEPGEPGVEGADGWMLLAKEGKAGQPGPRGERGLQGPVGPAGSSGAPVSYRIDVAAYLAVPVMPNGREGPALDLRPFFEQFRQDMGL